MVEHQHLTPALDRSVSLRRQVTSQAMHVFAGWGYREIQVPILDYFDSLKEGLDERQIARSFRFVDRTGNLMVLQPDITPAVAKVYAYQLQGTPLPLRLSYANNVVRIERSLTGEQLESNQLGIELIGARGLVADVEVLLIALEVLEELGLEHYQINVADHRTAKLLLNATGAPGRIREEVRRAIIARDPDAVREILTGLGAREMYVEAVAVLAELVDGTEQLEAIRSLMSTHVKVLERLDYLKALERSIEDLGYGEHVRLDLGELGGASYYTGLGFNVVAEGVGRELGRGGRYDDLVGRFGADTPAVGFSFSLETIVEFLHSSSPSSGRRFDGGDAIYVDPSDPIKGLHVALERRRRDKPTRIVSRPESSR
ncbi:ATP phosphoribosyltransferase regulatory subunit [Persicimonas caeni]|uniref:ATP phosphoribosyltransferase regulatory subunit n=1 Tax=Persicimonas caeni TaxID=2292766 RepID=UPI0024823370|nr:ATP phosphoribosyltransferase regulatory subunit [Persicimonas caeni]